MGKERVKSSGDGKWHRYPKERPEETGLYMVTIRGYETEESGRVVEADRWTERYYWDSVVEAWWVWDINPNNMTMYNPDNGSYEVIAWADEIQPYTGKVYNKETWPDDHDGSVYEEEGEQW